MTDAAGFFSYVRADDEADSGNLSLLRTRLAAEVRVQSGKAFPIFQDKQDILWGQRWRNWIDGTIDATTVLISIITPSYLNSAECRAELERFMKREEELHRSDLILPILYVPTRALEAPGEDHLASELGQRNHIDWTQLRFESFDTSVIRKRLAEAAGQLLAAAERPSEPAALATAAANAAGEPDPFADETPGFLELVADAEEAMPLFAEVLQELTAELEEITSISNETTGEMDKANASSKPAGAKVTLARKFAARIGEPADRMLALSNDYEREVVRVDAGIEAIAAQLIDTTDPEELAAASRMLDSLRGLDTAAESGIAPLEGLTKGLLNLGRTSKAVRPPLGRMHTAVQVVQASRPRFTRWVGLIEDALDVAEGGD